MILRGLLVLALGLLVTACGGGGVGTTLPAAPATPTGVAVSTAREALTVTWAPVPTATGYHVYLAPTSGLSRQALETSADVRTAVVPAATPCTFDGLPAGTTWFAAVDAYHATGRSGVSEAVPALLPPPAPEGVAATAGDACVTVLWNVAEGASAYDVYVANDPGLTSATWEQRHGGAAYPDATAPFEVGGRTNGVPCHVLVVARNASGTSPDSALATTTPADPTPPLVEDLAADAGSGEVTLTWSEDVPGALYVLYLALEPGITKDNWQDLEGGQRHEGVTSPFVVTDLEPDTTVYFVVTVLCDGVEGPESSVVAATPDARGTFRTGDLVAVGLMPCGLLLVDLDQDGTDDIVTANRCDDTLSVCAGLTGGHFDTALDVDPGAGPCALDAGDVDGDGTPDLAVALADEAAVVVLAGDGAFGFEEVARLEGVENVGLVRLLDLDADGALDLAAVDTQAGCVRLWLGDGKGSFEEIDPAPTGNNPSALAAIDVHGDGHCDLLVANWDDNSVSVLAGDGTGTFELQQSVPTVPGPVGLLVDDWNRDGVLDLCVAGSTGGCAELLTRDDDGVFGGYEMTTAGPEPTAAAAGDFDGDGLLDLAFISRSGGSLSAYDGHGDGSFELRQYLEALDCGGGPLVARDVDGDGILDLLFCAEGLSAVRVLLGND